MKITPENIRALTWKQPFANLMLQGKIETRLWATNYRGLVLIHAGATPYFQPALKDLCGPQYDRIKHIDNTGAETDELMPLGKAIGIGTLTDCRRMLKTDQDKCFVRWHSELFCHVYTDVRAIVPFELKGHQKWFNLDQETINKIVLL